MNVKQNLKTGDTGAVAAAEDRIEAYRASGGRVMRQGALRVVDRDDFDRWLAGRPERLTALQAQPEDRGADPGGTALALAYATAAARDRACAARDDARYAHAIARARARDAADLGTADAYAAVYAAARDAATADVCAAVTVRNAINAADAEAAAAATRDAAAEKGKPEPSE